MSTIPVKKKAVSGFIKPRWTKDRVVKYLERGAVPAILGLWWPDWLGSYAGGASFVIPPLVPALPPLLTYIGAVFLLLGCYEGIKNMGYHFKGLKITGSLTVLSAAMSLVFIFVPGLKILSLAFAGSAGYFGAGFMWFTISKVHEISQERRAKNTALAILVFDQITLLIYAAGLILLIVGNLAVGYLLLRAGVVSLTVTFFFCRYAVFVYKTQTSIGAKFAQDPDVQYWPAVE
jgi:hypothetical protein